jgi:acyl carrier protein
MMNNLDKLIRSFSETLGLDAAAVSDSLSYGDSPWNSVAHMAIIAAIETAFNIMIETEDVIDMSNFAKAKEIVEKYGIDIRA